MNRIEIIIAIILVLVVAFSLISGTESSESFDLLANIGGFFNKIIK